MEKKKPDRAYRLDKCDRVVSYVFTAFTFLAILAVVFIMVNTTLNILMRWIFRNPMKGSVACSQIVLSLVAMCSLPIVTMFNGHIKVDVVADMLPEKGQKVLAYLNLVICGAMCFIASYYTFIKCSKIKAQGIRMDFPKFPHWPIYLLIAIMFSIAGLCAYYNIFHYAVTGTLIGPDSFDEVAARMKGKKKEENN